MAMASLAWVWPRPFAGKAPVFFPNSIQTTDKEPALWTQFWADQGVAPNELVYIKSLGDGSLDGVAEALSHPKVRVVGLVVDKVDKIMHGMLVTEGGLTLMGADTPSSMGYTPGDNFSVSLSGEDEAELRRFWDGLAAGGTIAMPLERAPWGDTFGMCSDKFGVNWLVNIANAQVPGS